MRAEGSRPRSPSHQALTARQGKGNAMKWSPIRSVLLALVLAGCADVKSQTIFRSSDYRHHEDAVYVDFYWNCSRRDARTLLMQGVAAYKPSGSTIFYPTFMLMGTDRAGKIISKAAGRARSPIVGFTDSVPWEVVLPLHGGEVTFSLEYVYLWRDYGTEQEGKESSAVPQGRIIPAALTFMSSKVPNACGERAAGPPLRGPSSFASPSY